MFALQRKIYLKCTRNFGCPQQKLTKPNTQLHTHTHTKIFDESIFHIHNGISTTVLTKFSDVDEMKLTFQLLKAYNDSNILIVSVYVCVCISGFETDSQVNCYTFLIFICNLHSYLCSFVHSSMELHHLPCNIRRWLRIYPDIVHRILNYVA